MKYLIFDSEATAQEAAENLFIDALSNIASQHGGRIVFDSATKEEVVFENLTREEKLSLKIFGRKGNLKNYDSGFTTSIVNVIKAKDLEKWFFVVEGDFFDAVDEIPLEWVDE
jgi:hypothetical protein